MARWRRKRAHPPGTMPGTLVAHAEAGLAPARTVLLRYDADRWEERPLAPEEIAGLAVPETGVLWLDVTGLSDPDVVRRIGDRFGFHPLALEDVLNVPQRPKVEAYGHHLLIVLREVRDSEEPEQVGLFLADRLVVTFQERPGDSFAPVRRRIREGLGSIRAKGSDHLAYALCDAVIDAFFPTLERLGEAVEGLESGMIEDPRPEVFREIRRLRHRLLDIRRAAWPSRDAMDALLKDESGLVRPETKVFLRDCYDHTIQVIDMVERHRDFSAGLLDEYVSLTSNRLNEIIKVLTIIATIFIPLTFIAGVYGMNFRPDASSYNMPELSWRYGYPAVLLVMAAVAGGMLYFFRRKKWL